MSLSSDAGIALSALSARLRGRRVPLFVQVMPTERCNLRCRYCYAEFGPRRRPDFPLAPLLRLVDGLANLGTRVVMVAGGEPLLYPDLGKLVERIVGHGIICSVNTNGITLPARIEEVAKADMLSVSLDGPPALHDDYRGKGTYEKARAAIFLARKRGLRVQIQFTLTRNLIETFRHVEGVAEEEGCLIGINFLRPQERADGSRREAAEAGDEEVRNFLLFLLREKPPALPYPPHLIRYVLRWPYGFGRHLIAEEKDLRGFRPIRCRAGDFLLAIDNAGDIFPCTKLFYVQKLGNCADGDIERAYAALPPLRCQSCLDLGTNIINDLLSFHPASALGLLRLWLRRSKAHHA